MKFEIGLDWIVNIIDIELIMNRIMNLIPHEIFKNIEYSLIVNIIDIELNMN